MKKLESKKIPNSLLKKISGGDCYYNDKRYSDGAKIFHPDGSSQQCMGGSWS
ncbi:DUF1496 domain-containing protein [Pseudoalteromonas sp. GCY]|uniref:DUF1496 domain-containing protein n=1 Tax=Pseudoalteromonas sp. GCY TaxID=2003316 RepID=UPI001145E192|nr:DUF1496 domain-containing protein [Pseudoalteromonas sp. GCY]QQQ67255.1 DUF1496 domain-containing protein [Pseudoalteromonas sp. GCY]